MIQKEKNQAGPIPIIIIGIEVQQLIISCDKLQKIINPQN